MCKKEGNAEPSDSFRPETSRMTEQVSVTGQPEVAQKYKAIDLLAAECINSSQQVQPPTIHRFTPGMYIREIHMDKDSVAISCIHKTTHPFVISKGSVSVSEDGETWVHYKAPYTGITTPGVQRFLVMHEDTIWTTFHVNPDDQKEVSKLEERYVERPNLPPELMGNKEQLLFPFYCLH